MEAVTKKTFLIEFEGKKYALQEDMTLQDLLVQLGLPKGITARLQVSKEGFVLMI
jgi:sulfur carrier protein ThiS